MIYRKIIKRILDLILAIIALPFVLIICLIFGILIYIEDKGDIFYIAKRRGLNGSIFGMYKLRSMKMNAPDIRNKDNSTFNSANDPRVTKIGKILRKTSIDELPQVFNILKGDISIVGPRPIVEKETQIYGDDVEKLLSVKPGLTGYWQAYARNNATYESGERQKMEMYYVEHNSLWLDIKILFKTVISVIKKEGAQ